MAAEEVINKYTLKEWIRHPTTIILIVAVNLIWILIFIIVNMGKESGSDRVKDLTEQVIYLRDRVEKLERQQDEYTTAIMYKDAQIKIRDSAIDSLAKKGAKE